MMGRSAALSTGDNQHATTPSKDVDKSIIEVSREEEEEARREGGGNGGGSRPGTPTRALDPRGRVMSTPVTPTGQGNRNREDELSILMERRFQTLEQELARYKAEAGVEAAIKNNKSVLKEVVSGKWGC